MINLKLYDNVLLKDGRKASVVELFDGVCVVDIDIGGDYDTQSVKISDIVEVL